MEAPAALRPRAVTVIGWTWLIVAALRLVNSLLGLFVWKVGGLEGALPQFRFASGDVRFQVLGLEAMKRHATEIMLAQALVAAFVAWAAFELLRLKPWARTVIQAAAILGIPFAAGIGWYVYASTAELAAASPAEAETIRMAGAGAGAFIVILAVAFFGGTLLLLRRPAVAAAFPRSP